LHENIRAGSPNSSSSTPPTAAERGIAKFAVSKCWLAVRSIGRPELVGCGTSPNCTAM
jgi:hypothetical protein